MTGFDREMQRALMLDAQKLRDEGVDCPDPIFLDDSDPWPLTPDEERLVGRGVAAAMKVFARTRRTRIRPPRHFNPSPRFGLQRPACRLCRVELYSDENPIIHLGGGVMVKFGLCDRCLSDEIEDRRRWEEDYALEMSHPPLDDMERR